MPGGFYALRESKMMSSKAIKKPRNPNVEDCATAWFAMLDRARRVGDFERAAAAIRKLRELGVEVRFRKEAGSHA